VFIAAFCSPPYTLSRVAEGLAVYAFPRETDLGRHVASPPSDVPISMVGGGILIPYSDLSKKKELRRIRLPARLLAKWIIIALESNIGHVRSMAHRQRAGRVVARIGDRCIRTGTHRAYDDIELRPLLKEIEEATPTPSS
jgi:hypothetical protein